MAKFLLFILFAPGQPKIFPFDFAPWFAGFPEDQAFDVVGFEVVADALESAGEFDDVLAVRSKDVLGEVIGVRLEVGAEGFVGSVRFFGLVVIVGGPEPAIGRIIPLTLHPAGEVAGYRVGSGLALDRAFGDLFAALGVVSLVKLAVDDGAAGTVPLDGGGAFSLENPFEAGSDLGRDFNNDVIFKLSGKESRDFLHGCLPM